jgi:hypothetical protein
MTGDVEKLSKSPPPVTRKNGPLGTGVKAIWFFLISRTQNRAAENARGIAPSASLTQISFQYLPWLSV